MKTLLNNQECRIDNHHAGQSTNRLNGVHIHKTFRKNKFYSRAKIRIPLDGKDVKWHCSGKNAEKLAAECRKVLQDSEQLKNFVDVVVREMERYENTSNCEFDKESIYIKHREIAENILKNGFGVEQLEYICMTSKKYFGKKFNFFVFENYESKYMAYIGETRFRFIGKNKIQYRFE